MKSVKIAILFLNVLSFLKYCDSSHSVEYIINEEVTKLVPQISKILCEEIEQTTSEILDDIFETHMVLEDTFLDGKLNDWKQFNLTVSHKFQNNLIHGLKRDLSNYHKSTFKNVNKISSVNENAIRLPGTRNENDASALGNITKIKNLTNKIKIYENSLFKNFEEFFQKQIQLIDNLIENDYKAIIKRKQEEKCKEEKDKPICSGQGQCRNGICICDKREHPLEIISGEYCQCTNYRCPRKNGELCTGRWNGKCICNKCECKTGWIGEDCSIRCSQNINKCINKVTNEICSNHGTCECNKCKCEGDAKGRHCEKGNDICRKTKKDQLCSGRGICRKGKCVCNIGSDPNQKIYGQYCECTNYSCPTVEGKICGGHKRGECVCNSCVCKPGYTGPNCQCEIDENNCINPDTNEMCSNRGTCECNKCKCEGDAKGKWCHEGMEYDVCRKTIMDKVCSGRGFCDKARCKCDLRQFLNQGNNSISELRTYLEQYMEPKNIYLCYCDKQFCPSTFYWDCRGGPFRYRREFAECTCGSCF